MRSARRQKADKAEVLGIFRATPPPPLKDYGHTKSRSQLVVSRRTCADLMDWPDVRPGRKGPPTKRKGPPTKWRKGPPTKRADRKRKGPPTDRPRAPSILPMAKGGRVCLRNLVTATQQTNRSVGGPYWTLLDPTGPKSGKRRIRVPWRPDCLRVRSPVGEQVTHGVMGKYGCPPSRQTHRQERST
jgi:hypothetical protein